MGPTLNTVIELRVFEVHRMTPFILALSAASFIYIAIADLVPSLNRQIGLDANLMQLVLMLSGIAIIGLFHLS